MEKIVLLRSGHEALAPYLSKANMNQTSVQRVIDDLRLPFGADVLRTTRLSPWNIHPRRSQRQIAPRDIPRDIERRAVADVDRAVVAARTAFETFGYSSRDERLKLLERLLEVYMDRYQEMAEAISIEMGAPIDFAGRTFAEWRKTGGGPVKYPEEHQS